MIKIINANIIDGTKNKAYMGSLLIDNQKIVKVSKDNLDSIDCETIDAKGKYVTPGFIDIHRHADVGIFKDDFGKAELSQGITTIVNGNCGLSVAPAPLKYKQDINNYIKPIVGSIPENKDFTTFSNYLNEIERQGSLLNLGFCVGNGTLRMSSTGFSASKLRDIDKEVVKQNLKEALDAGALGVTMGLAYIPENNYSFEELVEVLSPMKNRGIPLSTHIRGEGNILVKAIDEVCRLAVELNVPLNVSHFKAVGKQNWGKHLDESIAILQETGTKIRVTCDVYPYLAGSSLLAQVLPPWVQDGGTTKAIERLKDKELRKKITQELSISQTEYENIIYSIGWESILLTGMPSIKNQKYIGKTIQEIADEENKDPFEVAYDLLVEEKFNVSMVDFIMCQEDVTKVMKLNNSSIISDSLYTDGGKPHPRVYGAFSEFLEKYIKEKKIMSIEEAIYKLTYHPASVYNLLNKGLIKEGYDADICIFDLENIKANATYQDPIKYSTGMDYVFVNGELVYNNGVISNNKCGKILRKMK